MPSAITPTTLTDYSGRKESVMSPFVRALAFVFPVLLVACAVDQSPAPKTETAIGALGDPTISTDASSYLVGTTVTVTYDGLPGNAHDWVAIATVGSAGT